MERRGVTVTVVRSGGRDRWGNPAPAEQITVRGCLVGGSSTSEDTPRSEAVEATANLYRRSLDFKFLSTDRVVVPEGVPMAGEYTVEGVPQEWLSGVHVGLRRV